MTWRWPIDELEDDAREMRDRELEDHGADERRRDRHRERGDLDERRAAAMLHGARSGNVTAAPIHPPVHAEQSRNAA